MICSVFTAMTRSRPPSVSGARHELQFGSALTRDANHERHGDRQCQ